MRGEDRSLRKMRQKEGKSSREGTLGHRNGKQWEKGENSVTVVERFA